MKFLIAITFLFSTDLFSNDTLDSSHKCTKSQKIETLQQFINKELSDDYEFSNDQQAFISKTNDNMLTIFFDNNFTGVEGYIGACPGGTVWGHLAIETTDEVLNNGLCKIKETRSSGLCED